MIDRQALVSRHDIHLHADSPELVLTLGNGDFAFSADATGLQTFTSRHDPSGLDPHTPASLSARILEGTTQSTWGWHEQPNPSGHALTDAMTAYSTARGPVRYPDRPSLQRMMEIASGKVTPEPPDLAGMWLCSNPHRLDLGRLGLAAPDPLDGSPGNSTDNAADGTRSSGTGTAITELEHDALTGLTAHLDLWRGHLSSTFRFRDAPVQVTTAVAGQGAILGTRVSSPLLAEGDLVLRLTFPDPNPGFSPAALWGQEPEGEVVLCEAGQWGAVVERRIDTTAYRITLTWDAPATAALTDARTLVLAPAPGTAALGVVAAFEPTSGPGSELYAAPVTPPDDVDAVLASSAAFWEEYWRSGAAVELAGSTDSRAAELERRIVLSQYLLRTSGGGAAPPQESGLVTNTWRGKFHLEMHWWHAAHFAAWGRPELLERSFDWYRRALPAARATAATQGCRGARWPKEVGPDAREAPGDIGPFLIWQQPHLLYLAELCWNAYGTRPEAQAAAGRARLLGAVAELLDETAEFMASFPNVSGGVAHLGPPVMPAQEFYDAATTRDPTFELAYWWFGLEIAQRFRLRRGLGREPSWDAVQAALPAPERVGGRYTAVAGESEVRTDDHPSFLQALGFLPPTPLIDATAMSATLDWVRRSWQWDSAWGWDYPVMAMTATRLGRPGDAVDLLLQEGTKNRYDAVGNNPGMGSMIPLYLPGNGGLLAAVALMVGGWEGAPQHPGFPDDGSWRIRAEGFTPWPSV
ncbi:hypothetical protein [Actinomyces qiguomingii]|uniref:hypothetical protein n=1 Tax=Actinomyces qiguomingii TaxID=2057800 RepID=UPI000CA01CAC|nr:hypothetical protein [Actinomyces qiguomingii]